MSITDELREWVSGAKPAVVDGCSISVGTMTYGCKKALLAIADRIDAEHERAEQDLIDANNQMEQLCECSIELPVDADGEYIHIGDVMEGEKIGGGYGEPFEVVGYVMSNGELEPMDEHRNQRKRKYSRHHHKPTVEDVLRNVVTLCHNTWKEESPFHFYDVDDVMKSGNIAEYASRLRLAGDAE